MKLRPLLCLLALVPPLAFASEVTRVYRERDGDAEIVHRFTFELSGQPRVVRLESETPSGTILQSYYVDDQMTTLAWDYDAPRAETKVRAERHGSLVLLFAGHGCGQDTGVPVARTQAENCENCPALQFSS